MYNLLIPLDLKSFPPAKEIKSGIPYKSYY